MNLRDKTVMGDAACIVCDDRVGQLHRGNAGLPCDVVTLSLVCVGEEPLIYKQTYPECVRGFVK
jgi:hypothetical protein